MQMHRKWSEGSPAMHLQAGITVTNVVVYLRGNARARRRMISRGGWRCSGPGGELMTARKLAWLWTWRDKACQLAYTRCRGALSRHMLSHQLAPPRGLIRAATSTHHVRSSAPRHIDTTAADADNTRHLYTCGAPAAPLAPNALCRTSPAIARQTRPQPMQPNRHTPLAPHGNCVAARATCSEMQSMGLQGWRKHENALRVPANILCTYADTYTYVYI